jgi:hypothetical protein
MTLRSVRVSGTRGQLLYCVNGARCGESGAYQYGVVVIEP